MTTLHSLAATLSNIKIDPSSTMSNNVVHGDYHIISFKYPAADLLTDDSIQPYLAAPANLGLRKQPDEVACHSNTIGTRFFAQLPVFPPSVFALGAARRGPVKSLHGAIDELRRAPGHSWLYMVSYQVKGVVLHRFRLQTSQDVHAGILGIGFSLTDDEWKLLVNEVKRKDWVTILDGLVNRRSDSAIYEVRKNLIATHGLEAAETEEARWEHSWAWNLPRSIEDVFLDRLVGVGATSADELRTGGDRVLDLRLPCTHTVSIRKVQIAALTDEARETQSCSVCGARILQAGDEAEIDLWKTFRAAEGYRVKNASWADLDSWMPSSGVQHRFSADILLQSIDSALMSINAPATFRPTEINPTSYAETQAVMKHFEHTYGRSDAVITTSALDLFVSLYRAAGGAALDETGERTISNTLVPPDFGDFLHLWLKRTVGFLVGLLELDGTAGDDENGDEEFEDMQSKMEDVEIT
jgi:hypothetical protein